MDTRYWAFIRRTFSSFGLRIDWYLIENNSYENFSLYFFFTGVVAHAQEKLPFTDEVMAIQKKYDTIWKPSSETIVFTGSSSIRKWHNLEERFPQHQIINSGFGGSKTSDLLIHSEELILRFNPKKVFIYEGDNDISDKIKLKIILENMMKIVHRIKKKRSSTEIILIAAKPSILHWNLKARYKRLNRKFKKIASKDKYIYFADIWRPMLKGKKVKQDIFIEDGLHMNSKGYDIWHDVLKPFVNEKLENYYYLIIKALQF